MRRGDREGTRHNPLWRWAHWKDESVWQTLWRPVRVNAAPIILAAAIAGIVWRSRR
jgi:hypothetical protein